MSELTLRFVSPAIRFGLRDGAAPGTAEVEGWRFRETYELVPGSGVPDDVGEYRLAIERDLTTSEDAYEVHATGLDLVERIDRLWTVAAGVPFGRSGFNIHLAKREVPTGWESNVDEVDEAIQTAIGGLTGEVSIRQIEWFYTSALPLQRLVTAVTSYERLDVIMKELIELHHEARRFPSRSSSFRLAKALEIVRKLLPGKDDEAREQSLPPEVRGALSHSLHWLYDVSNERRETRHAVRKGKQLALHPEWKSGEYQAFLRDADLIVRYVIGKALGLEIILVASDRA